MNNEKLLAVDLFSGAGGLSLGFLQTGQIEIVAAVENNKSAQKTYRRNHQSVKKVFGDIRKLNYNEIIEDCKNYGQNRVNIVFGGPPCQGFSNANRQKTELISTNNQLVKEYVKAIEKLNPDAFVMENVKAMKSPKHKFFYSSKDHQEVVCELGLHPTNERIALGKECGFTDELTAFLKKVIKEKLDLSEYTVTDKDLFSRISHLGRKEKESTTYLVKSQNALNRLFPNWINFHNKYWCNGYMEKWMLLGDLLQKQNLTESCNEEFYSLLNEIIQVQKILMKMHEIALNNIEIIDIVSEHKHIYIEVQTYGVLDYLTTKFKKLGYKLNEDPLFLNAANFGAPQLRERLFLIGVKSEIVGNAAVELPIPIINNLNQFYTVKHAIGDLQELQPHTLMANDDPLLKPLSIQKNPLLQYLNGDVEVVRNHVMTETTQTALDRFKMLEPGQNFHHLDESLKQTYSDPGRTQNTVYLRLNYDTPSGTVLNVRKSMWIHPQKTRAISIREAARLQTFPDNFIFEGSKDSQYQQIGNAVPPLLGRAVAEQVLKYLKKPIEEPLASIIKPLEPVTNS
ncbi:DNA cytosine methyltransferase [Paenibacillus frigoriresistens]|uniref:DNA cytosine methyltransferase n=1 Tax=Paenibacillus alginolyticus TaxID=59839 RepID=UPI0015642078|nr:DNA cytosine methyltransferase [Paenibacillus frigoriresistens]NRF93627.1 DNA cytosine methyltransferase [Paenibacillus frigoriresistens]